jgi:hypothetical protein
MAGKWKDLIDRTFGKVGTKRRDEQDKRVKEELAKMPSRSEAFVKAAHTFVNLTDDKLVALGEFRELLITGMELSATTVKEVAEVGRTTTRYVEEWIEGTSRPTRGQQCWVVEALMKKLAVKTLNAEMQDLISTHRSLTVPFDDETWAQLEVVSTTFGQPKTGSVRRCVRLAAWILENLKDGYKIGLLKKGESPRLVELKSASNDD